MSPAVEAKSSKKALGGEAMDIYTALLGLALLAMAATVAVVCIYGQQRFGSFFSVVV